MVNRDAPTPQLPFLSYFRLENVTLFSVAAFATAVCATSLVSYRSYRLSSVQEAACLKSDTETPSSDTQKAATVPDLLTLILTTSPVPSNPETALIEATVSTFRLAPDILPCKKILVCDGYKIKDPNAGSRQALKSFRAGVIEEDHVEHYMEYKHRLQKLIDAANPGDGFYNTTLLELDERQGFGFAVKAALPLVKTPYVIVVQHDRAFMRHVDVAPLLRVLEDEDDVKMISLLTSSTIMHAKRIQSRCVSGSVSAACNATKDDWIKAATPRVLHGQRIVPMLQWLDSTHVAKTDYYRNFVFNGFRVSKGGFIEDKLGSLMLDELRERGFAMHSKYGTWILDDETSKPMVGHWCGRGFLTQDEKRAKAAANKSKTKLEM